MHCKHIDTLSSYLYSASYCAAKDKCLQDQWNFKNNWCITGWVPGWKLNLDDDCKARPGGVGSCKGYTSTDMDSRGIFDNRTISLAAGGKCTLTVDATAFVARIIFEPYTEFSS